MEPGSMRETAGNFINHMISNLIFPLEDQDYYGEGKDFWCLDWWIVELAKYFFEGEVAYMRYPIARRLEGNTNFDKDKILKAAKSRVSSMEEMKLYGFDKIAVLENCRGLDTTLAVTCKDWSKIYVIIASEYPVVIEKTKLYLRKFPNAEVVGSFGVLGDPFFRMITDPFNKE